MTPVELVERGIARAQEFCTVNNLPMPSVDVVSKADWPFGPCAFWRPNTISICLELCARVAPIVECRNWNWLGSTTDREPYGVIAHEIGHCADWHGSDRRGSYFGNLSADIRVASGEAPLTSYCPDSAEWFAEHFRLFVTNHALLALLRPKTHALFLARWRPVSSDDWREELGPDVPPRVVRALLNKMPKARA